MNLQLPSADARLRRAIGVVARLLYSCGMHGGMAGATTAALSGRTAVRARLGICGSATSYLHAYLY